MIREIRKAIKNTKAVAKAIYEATRLVEIVPVKKCQFPLNILFLFVNFHPLFPQLEQPGHIFSYNIKLKIYSSSNFYLVEIGMFKCIRNNGHLKGTKL